jgi:hypothetical protein
VDPRCSYLGDGTQEREDQRARLRIHARLNSLTSLPSGWIHFEIGPHLPGILVCPAMAVRKADRSALDEMVVAAKASLAALRAHGCR